MFHLRMYRPRPDGTRDVPCDEQYRRVRPCEAYVTFSSENELIDGYAINTPASDGTLFFCSWKCIERSSSKRK